MGREGAGGWHRRCIHANNGPCSPCHLVSEHQNLAISPTHVEKVHVPHCTRAHASCKHKGRQTTDRQYRQESRQIRQIEGTSRSKCCDHPDAHLLGHVNHPSMEVEVMCSYMGASFGGVKGILPANLLTVQSPNDSKRSSRNENPMVSSMMTSVGGLCRESRPCML